MDIEVYLNDIVFDQEGLPLVVLSINGRKAIFTKQLANLFEDASTSSEILRKLRESGGYEQGDGWDKLTLEQIKEIQTWEKTMFGKSATECLLSPLSPNGVSIVFEEAALWVLARGNTRESREFAKLLVKTFVAVRDVAYIAPEGFERIQERRQYSKAEKELKDTVYRRGFKNIAYFIMRGDKAFYDHTTQQMRGRKGVPKNRALADFDTSIELTAKTLIKKTTNKNITEKGLKKEQVMLNEYVSNNKIMRDSLIRMGIVPENLPAEEDYRKLEKRAKKHLKDIHGVKKLT